MAGDDDQQHAERHDDDVAVLQHQIGQVDRLEQHAVGGELEEHHDDDQRQHQAVVAEIAGQRRDGDRGRLDVAGDAGLR